jgi:hypothetical protein
MGCRGGCRGKGAGEIHHKSPPELGTVSREVPGNSWCENVHPGYKPKNFLAPRMVTEYIYIYIIFLKIILKHLFILLTIVANFADFLEDKEFVTFFFKEIYFTKWQIFATKRNTTLNITHHKLFIVVLASALCLHAHSQFIYS